jgi:hypothetical protein
MTTGLGGIRGKGRLCVVVLSGLMLACACASRENSSEKAETPVASTGAPLVSTETSGLNNPSFEIYDDPSPLEGQWRTVPVPGWEFELPSSWWAHDPIQQGSYPPAAHGNQYLWLGIDSDTSDTDAITSTIKQRIGTLKPGTIYAFTLSVNRWRTGTRGKLYFEAWDGGSSRTVLGSSDWIGATGAWTDNSVTIDSSALSANVGRALYVVVKTTASSALIDNARVESRPANLASDPFNGSFESPCAVASSPCPAVAESLRQPRPSDDPAVNKINFGGTWQAQGAYWWLYRGGHPWGTATHGSQYLWVGEAQGPVSFRQPIGTVQTGTTYFITADINRRYDTSDGEMSLEAGPGCGARVAETPAWKQTLPLQAWSRVALHFDGASRPDLVGLPLTLVLRNAGTGGTLFDNVIVGKDETKQIAYLPKYTAQTETAPTVYASDAVHRTVRLRWTKGSSALEHKVYLSTDQAAVLARHASALVATRTVEWYDPPTLTAGSLYYWAVDELNAGVAPHSWPGNVWSFRVQNGKVSNASPPTAEGDPNASPVSTSLELSWTPGLYTRAALGHELFFSADRSKVEQADRSAATLTISDTPRIQRTGLARGATYYWRVDELSNTNERFEGPVWTLNVLPPASGDFANGYATWVTDISKHVFPPSTRPASANTSVTLNMAKGEYESAQIIVRSPGTKLSKLRLTHSGPSHTPPTGPTRTLGVDKKLVGYVKLGRYDNIGQKLAHFDGTNPDPTVGGWFPDPLLPFVKLNLAGNVEGVREVPANHAQPLLVTFHAPADTPAGTYTGSLGIATDNGEPTTIPVSIVVHDVTLEPGAGNCPTTFALAEATPACSTEKLAGSKYLQHALFALRHRVNPDDVYRNTPPDAHMLKTLLEAGAKRFTITKVDNKDLPGITNQTTALKSALADAGADVAETMKRAMFYGYDEVNCCECLTGESTPSQGPSPVPSCPDGGVRPVTNTSTCASECSGRAPMSQRFTDLDRPDSGLADIPRMTTAHVYDPWSSTPDNITFPNAARCPSVPVGAAGAMAHYGIDMMVMGQSAFHTRADAVAQIRQSGKQVWAYSGFANVFVPLSENRTVWWQMYRFSFDGYLYYQMNNWVGGIVNPELGQFTSYKFAHNLPGGEADLIYPASDPAAPGSLASEPIGSLRLANIRDGLEDFEYLYMLAAKTRNPERARTIAASVAFGVYDWPECPSQYQEAATHDAQILLNARSALMTQLKPRVKTAPSHATSQPIGVSFENTTGNGHDWIAIARVGDPNTTYLAWKYTNNTQSAPPTGPVSGQVTFAALPAGNYEARLFFNNLYVLEDWQSFSVGAP